MRKMALGIILVLAIIYVVPFIVYATFSAVAGLQTPEGSPLVFLLSVLVSKIGTAVAFVSIFYFARQSLSGRWPLYASIWWLMYVFGEVGQAIGPGYSWLEALAGIISETVYFPLSAYVVNRLIKK